MTGAAGMCSSPPCPRRRGPDPVVILGAGKGITSWGSTESESRGKLPSTSSGGTAPTRGRSVHDDADDLDADPERVELVTAAPAEVVIQVAAALVVEADPEAFPVARQLDLPRRSRRLTRPRPRP